MSIFKIEVLTETGWVSSADGLEFTDKMEALRKARELHPHAHYTEVGCSDQDTGEFFGSGLLSDDLGEICVALCSEGPLIVSDDNMRRAMGFISTPERAALELARVNEMRRMYGFDEVTFPAED